MFHRDWILETLAQLELWYWPIFFWDLACAKRYYAAYRAAHPSGMMAFGVTRRGRILLTLQVTGDRPDPNDWTAHAPRAPWLALDLAQLASAHFDGPDAPHLASACDRPEIGLVSAHDRPAIGPPLLDPG